MKLRLFEKRFAVVILAAMFFVAVPLFGQQVVNSRTLQGYTTIQAAINAASDGDTLLVAPATYQENVTVNKSVAIVGDQGRTPIIDGGTSGDVFTVTADRAMIKFLTIKSRVSVNYTCVKITADNVNVIGNNILDCFYGIHATSGADGTRIKENDLTNAEYGAVKIESNDNVVYNNHVHDIYRGIWVWGSVTRNVLCNNTVTGFENEGILTTSSDSWLYSNVVVGDNNPSTGEYGIMLMSATNNSVTANTVRECKYGLFLVNGANSNRIHHNNFIDNTCHAVIETVLSLSVNTVWHNGHGGNYFSGHTGTDANNDGIIDSTPFPVPDAYCNGQQDQDPYPLVGIWGPIPGNVDGSPDGLISISDLTYYIAYLFQNGNNDPVPPCVGDVNGDGILYDDDTVYGDIDYLVDYMFSSGPAPVANCCFFLVLPKYFN
jgi:parallel beta-helix repeat protein